jgi:hypothetical protein
VDLFRQRNAGLMDKPLRLFLRRPVRLRTAFQKTVSSAKSAK